MPIHSAIQLQTISGEDFAFIDYSVMHCAYSVQNKFGRLFDERVYENELAARLRAEGWDVHTQVPVLVTHADFKKMYYLDLIVNQMLYEIKVVANLLSEHDAQCLHYAMLQDIQLVKLINFGERKVRGKLLRNSLRTADRQQCTFQIAGIRFYTPNCERLLDYLMAIIRDWGTHLSSQIYNEALVHYFGGEAHCLERVELRNGALLLGTHRIQCHADGYAFVVTSLSRDQSAYEQHLNVLLTHTSLKAIHWINLNHSCVEVATIGPPGRRVESRG